MKPFKFLPIFCLLSCTSNFTWEKKNELSTYPSGSGIECVNKKIYLIGDDGALMMVMDENLNLIDSIPVFQSGYNIIPKHLKPDLEAMTVTSADKAPSLLLVGSGSGRLIRSNAFIVNPITKEKDSLNLDTFYNRIRMRGLEQLNIEGLVAIPGGFILGNRGNKSFPKNHLIITSKDFWKNQQEAPINIIPVGVQKDTASFNGLSGLEYSYRSDRLIMTISTEDTPDAYHDGSIGKSYLWIINEFSTKKRAIAINPNKIIDLEELDTRFKSQKIESACIITERKKETELILVADNDGGPSILFKIKLKL